MEMLITITTDFGYRDAYVGAMKGVILTMNPQAVLVDISHDVPPQDIATGGQVLADAAPYFPEGTIHLAVVDPGVGSNRRLIAARTKSYTFVAPDNGILTRALDKEPPERVVSLTEASYWLPNPSATFHGRDILAPIAARLSLGTPLPYFGPTIDDWLRLPMPRVERGTDGAVKGEVTHIDHYGNLITNLRPGDVPTGGRGEIFIIANVQIKGLSQCYDEGADLIAIVGSGGYIEIARVRGDAAQALSIGVGQTIYATNGPS
jgi:S-adenosyl-L-methionine hydrolase (adenosine-forming)